MYSLGNCHDNLVNLTLPEELTGSIGIKNYVNP